jgi:DNA-binding transcriptional LysR family regulator
MRPPVRPYHPKYPLTRAGRLFLELVPRVFAALEQARDSVKSATNGFYGQLRIALSAGVG